MRIDTFRQIMIEYFICCDDLLEEDFGYAWDIACCLADTVIDRLQNKYRVKIGQVRLH